MTQKILNNMIDVEKYHCFLEGDVREPEDLAIRFCPFYNCRRTIDIPAYSVAKMECTMEE